MRTWVDLRIGAFRDPRAWALWGLAGVAASRALAYLPGSSADKLPTGLREASVFMPIWSYGLMWLATFLGLGFIALFQQRARAWHFTFLVPPMLWGAFYFAAGLTSDVVSSPTPPNWFENAILFWFMAEIMAAALAFPPQRGFSLRVRQ